MKLGIAGTGKIVEDALFAMSPLEEVSVNAIFARPHSKAKGDALAEQYQLYLQRQRRRFILLVCGHKWHNSRHGRRQSCDLADGQYAVSDRKSVV